MVILQVDTFLYGPFGDKLAQGCDQLLKKRKP